MCLTLNFFNACFLKRLKWTIIVHAHVWDSMAQCYLSSLSKGCLLPSSYLETVMEVQNRGTNGHTNGPWCNKIEREKQTFVDKMVRFTVQIVVIFLIDAEYTCNTDISARTWPEGL